MSGSLAFKYFPQANWRPSGVNIEFSAAQANTAVQALRTLLVGQITGAGTAVANTPVQAFSQAQVNTLCGANSMLAFMYAAYRRQDPFGECWLGPLLDNGAGVAGAGTVVFSGTATAAGTLALYLMGVVCPVAVAVGDTATVVGANAALAVTAAGLPATANAVTGTLTLTAVHKGLAANDNDIRLNYVGVQNGEATPAGITAVITQFTAGVTNPVMTTLQTNLGTMPFDFIAMPYTDAASLNSWQAFLNDQAGRWSAITMLYGHVFSAFGGTLAARTTFGLTRNDQHCSILSYPNGPTGSPTPAWLESADWCGAHAIRIRVNPAQGVATQALFLQPPPIATVDTPGNRNVLLFDGLSTMTVDPAGICHIDRSVTTYQLNPSGQADNSYLNTAILFQAMYAARYISAQLTSMYISAGKILVANGTPINPGSPACTPNTILASVMAVYAYLCTIFIVQNPQTFARNAYATTGAKGQVLLYLPLDFSDQVISIGILAEFVQST